MLAVQRWSGGATLVEGTEPNERKRRSAAERGLHVDFHDLATHARTYDVISLLNVYSHLPDPPAFLQSLKRVLNPGGELVLETGDSAGLSARDHHRPFFLPDHLSFASEKIVIEILERLGFKIERITKYPLVQFEWGPFVRELLKAMLPGRRSDLRYYVWRRRYSQIDMFIRARLGT
jgi:SAM-dependent methyltransferase